MTTESSRTEKEGEYTQPPYAVIVNVKILVNAVAHGAVEDEADSRRLDLVVLSYDFRIGEVRTRGIVGDRAGILQDPAFSIGKDVVVTHVARVTRVHSLVGVGGDATIRLG